MASLFLGVKKQCHPPLKRISLNVQGEGIIHTTFTIEFQEERKTSKCPIFSFKSLKNDDDHVGTVFNTSTSPALANVHNHDLRTRSASAIPLGYGCE